MPLSRTLRLSICGRKIAAPDPCPVPPRPDTSGGTKWIAIMYRSYMGSPQKSPPVAIVSSTSASSESGEKSAGAPCTVT